jgi:DNA-binding MarR family transcriptional regulator
MLTDSIPFLLADCSRQVRYAFDAKARSVGVTRPQYRVLLSLARYGGATQSELAELLDVERITLGRMIDRMAEAGLVERRADPADRRVWRLHPLPAGEALVEQLAAIAEEVDAEALSHLAPKAREELKDHLVAMRDGMRTRRPDRKAAA